jgi:hypothetical protein
MSVKRIISFVFFPLLLAGCSGGNRTASLGSRALELPTLHAGRTASLLEAPGRLVAVSSDWESASLKVTNIPLDDHGLPLSPSTELTDTIDGSPTRSADFGVHASSMVGDTLNILYMDRRKAGRQILKWLSRETDGQWTVDALEPAGAPIALIPDDRGKTAAFWATDSLLESSGDSPRVVLYPFSPASAGCVAGTGFTVFDLSSRMLLFISFQNGIPTARAIPGGEPVHYSTLTSQGLLAVTTYSPETGRIVLREEVPGRKEFTSTTVALSAGTTSLFCSPYRSGYLFLYNGSEHLGRGGSDFALFLLAPKGSRYERYVLLHGERPLSSFQAVVSGNILYLLIVDETVKLLQISLPS